MRNRFQHLVRLEGDQLRASSPREHAALSASAGTGKTHVLTARVLRLLLSGADPGSILCLTFTKAGAAEMAGRIHQRLAHWVRLKDSELRKELFALHEPTDSEALAKARTLFAKVLDAPGGGLRIQTIHAFAQSLLASFPAEAGLSPGFRPLEQREEQLLVRQTLADALVRAERGGDLPFIRDLQRLSRRLGEEGAEAFLMRCARAPDAMESIGPREGIEARLRRIFALPAGDIEEAIAAACCDDLFDIAGLRRIGLLNRAWGRASGMERADLCERWLRAAPAERGRMLAALHGIWARKDGEIRSFGAGQAPPDEDYSRLAQAAFECCGRLLAMRRTAELVASLACGLRAGQTFSSAYRAAKSAAGVVDFDDLIRSTEHLLRTEGMGEWVRYKLDQATDHVLVDEAQDTNERQWNIVIALTLEFFAGRGANERRRTVFAVGDYKQAIFGFQGTNPDSFNYACAWFAREARASGRAFLDLSMDLSFRSSPQILETVDQWLAELGHEALGLPQPPNAHQSHHGGRAGAVTLWEPFSDASAIDPEVDAGEEGWIGETVRLYASRIARQIRRWIDAPFRLESEKRALRPEDILILVRRRSALAALIVARLHAEGVPVAGVDRLLLSAPLAVQDLLAAARFAVQPLDDLNLAALLVSPLFGWSQDDLFAVAYGREGALWPHLRQRPTTPEATLDGLGGILGMADYATPHQFFEKLLSGPLDGRRKLFERLGVEARDPIDELLARSLEFETSGAPSLQRFLDWFARGDVEVVRDSSGPSDAVRVMTVHGAKGLQAPVVILADACVDPERKGGGAGSVTLQFDEGVHVPVFRPRKDELAEPLTTQITQHDSREREEHWRLLYVALTRAQERLYIGGALGPGDRNGPPQASWYRAVENALASLGSEWRRDDLWGRARCFGTTEPPVRGAIPVVQARPITVPDWATIPAPEEERPPRPLAPSSLGENDIPEIPPAARAAADRGKLLHQLFERLPEVPIQDRLPAADIWLQHSAGVADPGFRSALAEDACRIIADPAFADIFGPEALSEAPIAAVTPDGSVITGTIDRLLVTADRVQVVDFKTGRRIPQLASDIPVPHLRQIAAYVAALQVIFPGREVEAGLLYTAGPLLYSLGQDDLVRYFPGES